MFKRIIIGLLALCIIGGGIGYYLYNKPVESLEHRKADVEVTATKLLADYEANESTANNLYLGKVVLVSGKITNITDEAGKKKINLDAGSPMSGIICELEDGKDAGSLKTGDEIKVKGKCSGYLSDVVLVQSNIVK
ncbi:MAG TPA: hypothetical protein VJ508_19025 [Saprospiraceae bacterium]|nr:hypothetical protein [Saprospiraceae bacterium]